MVVIFFEILWDTADIFYYSMMFSDFTSYNVLVDSLQRMIIRNVVYVEYLTLQ